MPECKMCTIDVAKVHPSGNCHDCEAYGTTDPVKYVPNATFKFDHHVDSTLVCLKCGATEFNIGKGGYWTAARCVKCKWERCIHEG